MKKTFLKAAALAVVLAAPSISMAAIATVVDLDATPTGALTFSSQQAMTDANPLVGDGVNDLNFTANIGFGVSNGQTRYIRLQYANATLDAAHAAVIGTDIEDETTNGDLASAAVVQGGAAGDNYVIYQITAGGDIASTDNFDFKIPALRVTSTASPVTMNMQLHETAVSAVSGASGVALLYSKTGNIATFASGLTYTLTPGANTAAVTTDYMKFCVSAADCTAANAVLTKALGTITYDVAGILDRDGGALALADLVTTADLLITGDFTAAAGNNNVFIDNNGGGCNNIDVTGTLNGGKTATTIVVNNTAVPAGAELCYTVNGTTAIPEQTVLAALDVKTSPVDVTTSDVAAASVGTIAHDGTVLRAPYSKSSSTQNAVISFVNTGATDADFTVKCYAPEGETAGTPGTIPANSTKKFSLSGVGCLSGTNAVEFTMAVPAGTVNGTFSRENKTTGDTGMDGMVGNEI